MQKRFDCTCLKKCNVKNDGKAVITLLFQSSHFIVDNVSVGFTWQYGFLWSPYRIGQTVIFPCCRLFYLFFLA